MQGLTVDLGALDLDLNNPRINPASHQTEAINQILHAERIGDRIGEKIHALAKSICELGSIDPSERLIVIANPDAPGRYIVLDGNRRITALKLLTEPTLLDRDDIDLPQSINRRLHVLRSEYETSEISTRIDVALAESREEAHPFIRLKHTGAMDGAGRSAWSPMQQARFEDTGTYKLLLRLRVDQRLNSQTLTQLDTSEFPISTFERAAASSEFTNRFGGRLPIDAYDEGANPECALFGWAQIANDAAEGAITSRTIQTTEEVGIYLQEVLVSFQAGLDTDDSNGGDIHPEDRPEVPPQSGGGQGTPAPPSTGGGGGGGGGAGDPSSRPTVRRPRAPRVRHYLIDRRSPLAVNQQKCRNLHDELMGKVKVTEAPYACAFLVRSFLELSAHTYLTRFGIRITSNFTNNIVAMANDLMSQQRIPEEPADKVIIGRALNTNSATYESLSDATHNVHVNLSPDHVRATWDSIEPALRLAWRRISGGAGQPH